MVDNDGVVKIRAIDLKNSFRNGEFDITKYEL